MDVFIDSSVSVRERGLRGKNGEDMRDVNISSCKSRSSIPWRERGESSGEDSREDDSEGERRRVGVYGTTYSVDRSIAGVVGVVGVVRGVWG
jgi:hypothetical protein